MARQGLPKKYAKMGFKKGWREYKKSKRKSGTKRRTYTKPRKTRKTRRKRRTVTKKKRNNSGGRGMRLHIGALAGALVPSIVDLADGIAGGDPMGGALEVAKGWTGYDATTGEWDMGKPMVYYGSAIAGIIATKLAAKLGINRYLPKGINI